MSFCFWAVYQFTGIWCQDYSVVLSSIPSFFLVYTVRPKSALDVRMLAPLRWLSDTLLSSAISAFFALFSNSSLPSVFLLSFQLIPPQQLTFKMWLITNCSFPPSGFSFLFRSYVFLFCIHAVYRHKLQPVKVTSTLSNTLLIHHLKHSTHRNYFCFWDSLRRYWVMVCVSVCIWDSVWRLLIE